MNNNETGSLHEVVGHVLSRLSSLQSDKNGELNAFRLEVEKLTSGKEVLAMKIETAKFTHVQLLREGTSHKIVEIRNDMQMLSDSVDKRIGSTCRKHQNCSVRINSKGGISNKSFGY